MSEERNQSTVLAALQELFAAGENRAGASISRGTYSVSYSEEQWDRLLAAREEADRVLKWEANGG